ncbi:DUF393 domain-containing protein [Magnetovibrio sp. PR-2]|uniref:thiol-disulfide oxidoreductase DCC family protein n=1 Tax=Magnetovibrio sp. PR-2 TaxID=3120356 RepID=UPI002FCE31D0
MTNTRSQHKLTVYYDGACPLCSREIAMYKFMRGGDAIHWKDLREMPPGEVLAGLDREEALKRFTVKAPDGQVHSGGDAFSMLWTTLPKLRLFGCILRIWPITIMLEGGYRLALLIRPSLQKVMRLLERQGA